MKKRASSLEQEPRKQLRREDMSEPGLKDSGEDMSEPGLKDSGEENISAFWLNNADMPKVRTNYRGYESIITRSISSDPNIQRVIEEVRAMGNCELRAKGYLSIMSHGGTITIPTETSDKKTNVVTLAKPINMTFIAPIGIKKSSKPKNRENVGKFYYGIRQHLSRDELAQLMIFDGSESSAVFEKIFERRQLDGTLPNENITDEYIDKAIDEVLAENRDLNRDYLTLSVNRRAEIYNHPLSFSSWHGTKVIEKRISYNNTNIFLDNPSVMLRIKFKHANPDIDTTTFPYITIKLFSQYLPNTTEPDRAPASLSNLINISLFIIEVINSMMFKTCQRRPSALDAQNIPMLDVFDASCSTTRDEISKEDALQMAEDAKRLNAIGLIPTQEYECEIEQSTQSTQGTESYEDEEPLEEMPEKTLKEILEEMPKKIQEEESTNPKNPKYGGAKKRITKRIKKRVKITKRRTIKFKSKRRTIKSKSKRRN